MSYCYWGINGYGIDLEDINEFLNEDKVKKILSEQGANVPDGDIDDFLDEGGYACLAHFVASLDKTHTLSYRQGGDFDGNYVLFEPLYPWDEPVKYNELKTKEGMTNFIVKILQKVYDTSSETLIERINYIDAVGSG